MEPLVGNRKVRVAVLALAALVLAAWSVSEAADALRSGSLTLHMSRSGKTYFFERSASPAGFYFWVCFDIGAAVFLGLGSALGIRAICRTDSDAAAIANKSVSLMERRAPSGLLPLWLGIAAAFVVALLYVAA